MEEVKQAKNEYHDNDAYGHPTPEPNQDKEGDGSGGEGPSIHYFNEQTQNVRYKITLNVKN